MTLLLGLDIGGTKTRAILTDASGTVLDDRTGPTASIQSVGAEGAGRALDELLAQFDDLNAVQVVVAGSAGLDTPALESRLAELLRDRVPGARTVLAVHDTRLLLAAGELTSGCVLIFGTGSAAWALAPDGGAARSGGWGWLLGDEGSGYGLVREAIRWALADLDSGRQPSLLTGRLIEAVGVDAPVDLIGAVYGDPGSGKWARHSDIVFGAARDGCPSAASVVEFVLDAAAGEVIRACRRVDITGPVVLAGGVVANVDEAVEGVRQRCEAAGLREIARLHRDPVWGAVDLALAEWEEDDA